MITHDLIEGADQVIVTTGVDPLGPPSNVVLRLREDMGVEMADAIQLAGILRKRAEQTQLSLQQWRATVRYAELDRQHDEHLDGVRHRRGR